MSFRDIKGQDSAISFLKGVLKTNRIAHAYIFFGPSGGGKSVAALNFAKALNCTGEVKDRPCDGCASCKKIDGFNHPDVDFVEPEEDSKAIKIERIRELIRRVGLKPYEAKWKVSIIDEAGLMTQEASNALLKTLEEPPSDSVLILITDNTSTLLPTIVSRAQLVKFLPLSVNVIKDILVEVHKVDDAKAEILSRLSSGKLDAALRYREKDFFALRAEIIESIIDGTMFESDFEGLSRADAKLYLDVMLAWYRDILISKLCGESQAGLFNIDNLEVASSEAKRFDFGRLDNIIKEIIYTSSLLDENVNPKLAMSVLGFKIKGE